MYAVLMVFDDVITPLAPPGGFVFGRVLYSFLATGRLDGDRQRLDFCKTGQREKVSSMDYLLTSRQALINAVRPNSCPFVKKEPVSVGASATTTTSADDASQSYDGCFGDDGFDWMSDGEESVDKGESVTSSATGSNGNGAGSAPAAAAAVSLQQCRPGETPEDLREARRREVGRGNLLLCVADWYDRRQEDMKYAKPEEQIRFIDGLGDFVGTIKHETDTGNLNSSVCVLKAAANPNVDSQIGSKQEALPGSTGGSTRKGGSVTEKALKLPAKRSLRGTPNALAEDKKNSAANKKTK